MNRLHPLIRTQFARRWGYLLILREGNYSIFRDGETENCRTVRQRVQPLCFLERRLRVRVTVGSYQTVAMSQSFCRPRCRWIRRCSPPAAASKSLASAPNMAKPMRSSYAPPATSRPVNSGPCRSPKIPRVNGADIPATDIVYAGSAPGLLDGPM